MGSSLSNFFNSLSEGINIFKCNYRHDDKKRETCRIKYKYCDCFLENTNFKNILAEYNCLYCNEKLKENLKE